MKLTKQNLELLKKKKDASQIDNLIEVAISQDGEYAFLKTKDKFGEVFLNSPLGLAPQVAEYLAELANLHDALLEAAEKGIEETQG